MVGAHQLVAGKQAPGRDVLASPWIVGDEMEQLARVQLPHPDLQLDHQFAAANLAGVPARVLVTLIGCQLDTTSPSRAGAALGSSDSSGRLAASVPPFTVQIAMATAPISQKQATSQYPAPIPR